jgi:predicted MPP superfamily phosphohydrolase
MTAVVCELKLQMKKNKNKKKKLIFCLISFAIILAGAFFVDSICVEPNKLEIKNIEVKTSDLSVSLSGKKIVFLSDIHYGVGNPKMLDRAVDEVNNIDPDIVVLGGDYVDRDPKYVGECFRKLRQVKAKIGVYAVLGNHDMNTKIYPKIMEEFKNSNIDLLFNDKVAIKSGDSRLIISGIPFFKKDKNLSIALADTKEDDFVILVSHSPDIIEQEDLGKVDVILSGHLHGGQVNLLGLERLWIPSAYGGKYKSGTFMKNDTELIVSKGLGGSTLPMRFMAEPDIISLVLSGKR